MPVRKSIEIKSIAEATSGVMGQSIPKSATTAPLIYLNNISIDETAI